MKGKAKMIKTKATTREKNIKFLKDFCKKENRSDEGIEQLNPVVLGVLTKLVKSSIECKQAYKKYEEKRKQRPNLPDISYMKENDFDFGEYLKRK